MSDQTPPNPKPKPNPNPKPEPEPKAQPLPPFPLASSATQLIAGSAALLALAIAACRAWGVAWDNVQIQIAVVGWAMNLLAGLVVLSQVADAAKVSAQRVATVALMGSGVRIGVAMVGGIVLVLALNWPSRATGLWIAGWYPVFLIGEVWLLANFFKKQASGGPAPRA